MRGLREFASSPDAFDAIGIRLRQEVSPRAFHRAALCVGRDQNVRSSAPELAPTLDRSKRSGSVRDNNDAARGAEVSLDTDGALERLVIQKGPLLGHGPSLGVAAQLICATYMQPFPSDPAAYARGVRLARISIATLCARVSVSARRAGAQKSK